MGKKIKFIEIPKTEKETLEELGILFPNGNIDWEFRGMSASWAGDSRTKEGRKAIQNYFDKQALANNMTGGKLRYVKRTITTSFSTPILSTLSTP